MKPQHLTQKETDEILGLFTVAREHMRLQQWDLIIMDEPPDDETTIVEVTPQDNHFCAQLRVRKDFGKEPLAVKRDTVVHELLHLCHRDLTDLWHQVTFSNKGMSESDAGLLHNFWFVSVERMVSHLSKIVSDGIDWPSSKIEVGQGICVQGDHR